MQAGKRRLSACTAADFPDAGIPSISLPAIKALRAARKIRLFYPAIAISVFLIETDNFNRYPPNHFTDNIPSSNVKAITDGLTAFNT
ncbi:hypothetical protein ACL2XP_01855 [Sodalis sp. RH21]|uniref:hypothetical protein n=1 Tax=unclassified Sodalis (in: enterobacteria) TaxID=2636512 RepID=UPI0039B4005E